jgi:hypothetical protein
MRKIFGPKRDEVTRRWRRLHNEKLCDLYCSPSIFQVMKPRRIRWIGHAARMGGRRDKGSWRGDLRERPFGTPRCRWVLEKWNGGTWTGSSLFTILTGGGLL